MNTMTWSRGKAKADAATYIDLSARHNIQSSRHLA